MPGHEIGFWKHVGHVRKVNDEKHRQNMAVYYRDQRIEMLKSVAYGILIALAIVSVGTTIGLYVLKAALRG